jgi:chemotaxis family two-component system sensor kinase Cph1
MDEKKTKKRPDQTVVDPSNCDTELIHIPGKIQSHGFLVAVHKDTYKVCFVSDNMDQFIQADAGKLVDLDFKNFVSLTAIKSGYVDLFQLLQPEEETDFEAINPVGVKFKNRSLNLIIHRSGDFILFEFEPPEPVSEMELHRLIGISLSRILEARTLEKTLHFAAKQIRQLIHYDRVMIYRFQEDDHGEVIAEDKNIDLEPFFGLHYPAADIPRQARDLYKINLVRIIANVHSTAAALVVVDENYADEPLDLTHSTLRAVSPIHIEYLKNMGVEASFSISIIVKGQLWGLIACHNYQPRFVDYRARNSAKLIGKILSSSIEHREEEDRAEALQLSDEVLRKIMEVAVKDWDIADSLMHHPVNMMQLNNAGGAALLLDQKIYLLGNTPSEGDIQKIAVWLRQTTAPAIFNTDHFSSHYASARAYADVAAGMMSCTISKELNEYLLWFKPERKMTVKWAGNPEKAVGSKGGTDRLSPRSSFAAWTQEVSDKSDPWNKGEVLSAIKLREEVIYLIGQKANQLRKMNEELQKAYNELDTFSFTISHDLKTPLASILNYTEMLLEAYADIPEGAKKMLEKVVQGADKMALLIKEVLSYSKIDRQELVLVDVDMGSMLESIKHEVLMANVDSRVDFILKGTPPVMGDKTMVYQVFANLIGNAVKYCKESVRPMVEVIGQESPAEVLYMIRDNGIGMGMHHGDQIFELFKRLDNAAKYEGTGVGLAIVKRIMEKHQAKIWYESTISRGTTFFLAFGR